MLSSLVIALLSGPHCAFVHLYKTATAKHASPHDRDGGLKSLESVLTSRNLLLEFSYVLQSHAVSNRLLSISAF